MENQIKPTQLRVKIVDLGPNDEKTIQVAQILIDAFAHMDYVRTIEAAVAEVRESFADKRISRVALDENGDAVGWIGGIEQYDGTVYELHPLAVKPSAQRRGIGTALVKDFEAQVKQRGALTITLGTDDDFGGTSLFGVDVYPNVLEQLSSIRNRNHHPYEFYLKCGYSLVGLVPDANGFGKPDILMAKRVGKYDRTRSTADER